MARELRLRRRRAREAAEEARTLARRAERGRMLGRSSSSAGSVELDVSGVAAGAGSLCAAPVRQIRAVAARLGARLAEVADERLHLAAVVLDERDDALRSAPPPTARAARSARRAGRAARRATAAARAACSAGARRRPSARRGPAARGSRAPRRRARGPRRARRSGSTPVQMRPSLPLASTRRRNSARSGSKAAKTSSHSPLAGRTL